MTDKPFTTPGLKYPARQAVPGELLFQFVRARDRMPMTCELRTHREYGVEAQFLENGTLLYSRRFPLRELAITWAEQERKAMETAR